MFPNIAVSPNASFSFFTRSSFVSTSPPMLMGCSLGGRGTLPTKLVSLLELLERTID